MTKHNKKTRNKRTKRSRKTTLKLLHSIFCDTLTFYRKYLGFIEPSTVLIDGSMFYYLTVKHKTVDDILELIKDPKANLSTTDCVVREMEFFLKIFYGGSNEILEESIKLARAVDRVSCRHGKEVSAEMCLRAVIGVYNSDKKFVATTVNGCWPLINENPSIPIITVYDGCLVLKKLYINQRQNAKCWSSTTAVKKSAITDEQLQASADYQRLSRRVSFYGYEGEIALGDGNNQVKAISEQLGSSKWSHERVREFVVNQILLRSELYENRVNSNLTFLEYLYCTSKDGEWGDLVTLQAAADAFEVKIVALDSSEECAVYDFCPYDVEHPNKVLCLSRVTCRDETHYNSIHKLQDRSIASTCSHNHMDPELEEQDNDSEVFDQGNP